MSRVADMADGRTFKCDILLTLENIYSIILGLFSSILLEVACVCFVC